MTKGLMSVADWLFRGGRKPRRPRVVRFRIVVRALRTKGRKKKMAGNNFAINSDLLVTLTNVVDASGNPATFQNPPVYSTSDSTILTLTAASDGMSATGVAQKTGSVVITVVGDGVAETTTVDVVAGTVVSFQINVALAPASAPASGSGS